MVLLNNGAFLDQLNKLYATNKTKGSVWITMKRYEDKSEVSEKAPATTKKGQVGTGANAGAGAVQTGPAPPEGEYKCLIRATDGSTKISTLVKAKDLVRFQLSFATCNKTNMDGLKKRDRKNRRRGKKKPTLA
eukprot:TRINITY_DN7513_c0_g1_i1.p2 TRINITY_DN7513_c0_g1~~TRINITY_DN7513_c0_g1_i1.p2  ORF type:complete len:133 (+),score=28.93 TRINITY_DN7513_c0_g1_i1:65-463(+)